MECSFEFNIYVYEESLKTYLSTIEDLQTISISDLEEMVAWESIKQIDKGDLIVNNIYVICENETPKFNQWFDKYLKEIKGENHERMEL